MKKVYKYFVVFFFFHQSKCFNIKLTVFWEFLEVSAEVNKNVFWYPFFFMREDIILWLKLVIFQIQMQPKLAVELFQLPLESLM